MRELLLFTAGLAFLASLVWWVSVVIKLRRLALLMKDLKVGEGAIHGWVAVNGNLENTLVIQSLDEEGVAGPGSIPVWLHEEAGEAFLAGLES